jgi:hypothetical protein
MWCVAAAAEPPDARRPEDRMRAVGGRLRALADRPLEEFGRYVFERHRERLRGQVATLAGSLALHGRQPEAWARDVDEAVRRLRERVAADDDSWTFSDLAGARAGGEARRLGQRLVGEFGRLLEAWPDLFAAARRLQERGIRPADPPARK